MSPFSDYIPTDIVDLYEIHDYRHASAILANEYQEEFRDICCALREFRLTRDDITQPGGNESLIPKKLSKILRPLGWKEKKLQAKLVVDEEEVSHDTHFIDYVKGRVALDLEWNSKDQTFDRDLYAFQAFFNYSKISLGILITRSDLLDSVFASLGKYVDSNGKTRAYKDKYGASTTHMGKLLPRLKAGRSGGCPVLVFGITPRLIVE